LYCLCGRCPGYIPIRLTPHHISSRLFQGNIRNSWESGSDTFLRSPHVATAAIAEPLRKAWSSWLGNITANVPSGNSSLTSSVLGLSLDVRSQRYPNADIRTVRVPTQIPVVRTVCVPTQGLEANDDTLMFPVLPEYDYWYWTVQTMLDSGMGTYGNGPVLPKALPNSVGSYWIAPMNTSFGSLSLKTTWVELSEEFGSTTAGLAILFPPTNDTVGGVSLSCTIDARWAQGQNWVTSSAFGWDKAISLDPMQATPDQMRPNRYKDQHLFAPKDNMTWRRIFTSPEYLESLTPPLSNGSTLNTLESLLLLNIPKITDIWYPGEAHFSNSSPTLVPFVEQTISSMVVDGLSRTGSHLQRSPITTLIQLTMGSTTTEITRLTPGISEDGRSTTPMRMETSVEGYAYLFTGFPMYLSAAVLLAHSFIALLHTAWVLRTRKTSNREHSRDNCTCSKLSPCWVMLREY
jgi:hypothetical protein